MKPLREGLTTTSAPGQLSLSGRIDDAAHLGDLAAKIPAGDIVIDTDGVTFINSIGMREFMRLVRALRDRGKVTFSRVADVLITQMNMRPEFAGSTITSFHAQYVCGACGAEAAPLVIVAEHAEDLRWMRAPKLPCPECRQPMDLADFPERYLTLFKA